MQFNSVIIKRISKSTQFSFLSCNLRLVCDCIFFSTAHAAREQDSNREDGEWEAFVWECVMELILCVNI
jgi:hypothetical protein